jgi:hypothetical protein
LVPLQLSPLLTVLAGESYAGRWIPLIAAQLLRDNEEAVAHPEYGIEPLPLAVSMTSLPHCRSV